MTDTIFLIKYSIDKSQVILFEENEVQNYSSSKKKEEKIFWHSKKKKEKKMINGGRLLKLDVFHFRFVSKLAIINVQ